jgi:multidrug resistance efflux pump
MTDEQYPTVWAYEQACKTLETTKNEVRDLKAQLRVAEQAYGEQKIKCAYQFAKREEAERMVAELEADNAAQGKEIERLTHLEAQACANLDAAQGEIERLQADAAAWRQYGTNS